MNQLQTFKDTTAIIRREATDIANLPVVVSGYQKSGRPHATVFLNITSMATKRLRKYYPLSTDLKDPMYARLFARIQKICSECIRLKYETREQRIDFNHLHEIDRRVDDFFSNEFPQLQQEYIAICSEVDNAS